MMMAGAVGRPLTDGHTAWLLRHGLLQETALGRYQAYALPDLITYAYPRTGGDERRLLVDILGWFTILDDHFDGPAGRDLAGARDLVRRLLDVLDNPVRNADEHLDGVPDVIPDAIAVPEPPAGPAHLLAAWRDLWDRQRTGMPAAWSRRAARDWARCLTTFVTEAFHRTAVTLPTVRQAVHLRRHASCLYPFMNMLERAPGAALPEEVHAERELRLLRAHVADTATLINDLYSLEREERHSCPFNMIVILRREQRMSRAAAVAAVRAEVDRLGARSDILRNYLAAHHPGADRYLRGTRQLVEGVRLWSSTTNRYTDASL
ncbi:terpene synthase family protein [Streptomyces sp. 8L]|uniref:terpene synthase family protein n=1 Tax=Streptomyces sp. 8L TaxID=2877242 RepID=UPI001CD501BB|nr:terpene synthase family protein [Streptomyces sp. 8L]MCA1224336.1 terpene synthase family protein [Streptomyces sp. 8L]